MNKEFKRATAVSPFAAVPSAPRLLEEKTLKDGKVRDLGEVR
jgi:hypothetical protein